MFATFSSSRLVWGRPALLVFISLYSIMSGIVYTPLSLYQGYFYWPDTFQTYPINENIIWYLENVTSYLLNLICSVLFLIAGILLLKLKKRALVIEYTIMVIYILFNGLNFYKLQYPGEDFDEQATYEAMTAPYLISLFLQILIVFYIRHLMRKSILT